MSRFLTQYSPSTHSCGHAVRRKRYGRRVDSLMSHQVRRVCRQLSWPDTKQTEPKVITIVRDVSVRNNVSSELAVEGESLTVSVGYFRHEAPARALVGF